MNPIRLHRDADFAIHTLIPELLKYLHVYPFTAIGLLGIAWIVSYIAALAAPFVRHAIYQKVTVLLNTHDTLRQHIQNTLHLDCSRKIMGGMRGSFLKKQSIAEGKAYDKARKILEAILRHPHDNPTLSSYSKYRRLLDPARYINALALNAIGLFFMHYNFNSYDYADDGSPGQGLVILLTVLLNCFVLIPPLLRCLWHVCKKTLKLPFPLFSALWITLSMLLFLYAMHALIPSAVYRDWPFSFLTFLHLILATLLPIILIFLALILLTTRANKNSPDPTPITKRRAQSSSHLKVASAIKQNTIARSSFHHKADSVTKPNRITRFFIFLLMCSLCGSAVVLSYRILLTLF